MIRGTDEAGVVLRVLAPNLSGAKRTTVVVTGISIGDMTISNIPPRVRYVVIT